jgi:Mg-chelatase subunit ChlI
MPEGDVDEVTFTDLSKFRKKEDVPEFPLVRIVGQTSMNKALLLIASNPAIGNLLIMGELGTGKGTAAKRLRDLLPEIDVVADCQINCDPKGKTDLCPKCTEQKTKGELKKSKRPIPLIELPIGASEKRIFGGFDHKGLFKAGIIGRANRGYLIVERANLLDQGVLVKLLDEAERGVHKHEGKEGEYVHPSSFNIIATLNPEDGELEVDVLNRFNLIVGVKAIKDIEERIEIVRRVEAYKVDPKDFVMKSQREIAAFKKRIEEARNNIKRADVPKKVTTTINKVIKKVGQDNDWVKKALEEAALANAVFNDRLWVTIDDVAEVAEMVLEHRVETE